MKLSLTGLVLLSISFAYSYSFVVTSTSEPVLPETPYNYENITLPAHYLNNDFPAPFQFQHAAIDLDNTPFDNAITDTGATLGRVIFYDKKLSANGTVSCASCHHQDHGFSDPDTLSIGFDGVLTRRHSMGLANARFYNSGKFFWDERAQTLEDQVLMPFQDSIEMGLTLPQLDSIIASQSYYPELFENAFGSDLINSDRIAKALAQFVRSIVNTSSKYDIERSAVSSPIANFPGFTAQENMGKTLFFLPQPLTNGNNGNCAACHMSEAFVGPIPNTSGPTTDATTNGLDAFSTVDLGIFETTGNPSDIGKFKAPSLVNISIRPPYMHDGRFSTLEEVIDHYSDGIQNHSNLIFPLVNDEGEVGHFDFTQVEKDALIAFLQTLTDYELLTEPKYSNPFITAFTFEGNIDNKYDKPGNWDIGFVPPISYKGQIFIDTNCVFQDTMPFYLNECNELIIRNNSTFEIKE